MSLKLVHIAFIALSSLFSLLLGAICIANGLQGGQPGLVALGAVAVLAAGGLVVYGRRFLHKMKDVGFL